MLPFIKSKIPSVSFMRIHQIRLHHSSNDRMFPFQWKRRKAKSNELHHWRTCCRVTPPDSESWLVFHLAHIQLICTGSGMQSSGSLSTEFEIFLTFKMCQSGLFYETKEKKWAEPNSLPICTNLTEKLFPNFWKLDAMDETVVSATTVFRVLNYDLG